MKIFCKKLSKCIVALLLVFSLIEVNQLPSYASTKVPKSSVYVDLSMSGSSLSFQVRKLTYGNLFTNSNFLGVSSVAVHIQPVTVTKGSSAGSAGPVTVHLHKQGSDLNITNTVSVSGGTVYFNKLSKKAKYYLEFSKKNDGKLYAFPGSIEAN